VEYNILYVNFQAVDRHIPSFMANEMISTASIEPGNI
jgi:hypothetical protein